MSVQNFRAIRPVVVEIRRSSPESWQSSYCCTAPVSSRWNRSYQALPRWSHTQQNTIEPWVAAQLYSDRRVNRVSLLTGSQYRTLSKLSNYKAAVRHHVLSSGVRPESHLCTKWQRGHTETSSSVFCWTSDTVATRWQMHGAAAAAARVQVEDRATRLLTRATTRPLIFDCYIRADLRLTPLILQLDDTQSRLRSFLFSVSLDARQTHWKQRDPVKVFILSNIKSCSQRLELESVY